MPPINQNRKEWQERTGDETNSPQGKKSRSRQGKRVWVGESTEVGRNRGLKSLSTSIKFSKKISKRARKQRGHWTWVGRGNQEKVEEMQTGI